MSDERGQLETATRDAENAVCSIEHDLKAAIRAAEARIRAEYSERLREAKDRLDAAQFALREHVDAAISHPWEGRRVFSMKPEFRRGRKIGEKRLDGIVEVRRQGTPMPGNRGSYSLPRLGDAFVRKVAKDGKPGIAIHPRRYGGSLQGWQLVEESQP